VWRLNVLTANHLCEMFFDTRGRGLVRLKQLYEMGVLDRFQPYREGGGSEPYHYVLGRDGAAMVAAWTGADVDKAVRRYRGNFGTALARRAVLRRSVAVSGFYARLVATQRVNPRCRLRDWLQPEEVAKSPSTTATASSAPARTRWRCCFPMRACARGPAKAAPGASTARSAGRRRRADQ
jgi:hypothetical protein